MNSRPKSKGRTPSSQAKTEAPPTAHPPPPRPLCICTGCAGHSSGRPCVPAHHGQCDKFQQRNLRFGLYCKSCARNYQCSRGCGNAYDFRKQLVENSDNLCRPCQEKAATRRQHPKCICEGCSGLSPPWYSQFGA